MARPSSLVLIACTLAILACGLSTSMAQDVTPASTASVASAAAVSASALGTVVACNAWASAACICSLGTLQVDCSGLSLTTLPIGIPLTTKVLLLNNNQIKDLPSLTQYTLLETLQLKSNLLTTFPTSAFLPVMPSLKVIHLSGSAPTLSNVIPTLQASDLAATPNLENLVADRISLTTVASGLFQNTPNMTFVNFENNQLTTLPPGLFQGLRLMGPTGFVSLLANPFVRTPPSTFGSVFNPSVCHYMCATCFGQLQNQCCYTNCSTCTSAAPNACTSCYAGLGLVDTTCSDPTVVSSVAAKRSSISAATASASLASVATSASVASTRSASAASAATAATAAALFSSASAVSAGTVSASSASVKSIAAASSAAAASASIAALPVACDGWTSNVCDCNEAALTVNCSSRSLTVVPRSIPSNTQSLDLSSNLLATISANVFSS
ncbi:hypothetical protein CAOG_09063, partial [Capsaspora owczarzaki ATCC 30864]